MGGDGLTSGDRRSVFGSRAWRIAAIGLAALVLLAGFFALGYRATWKLADEELARLFKVLEDGSPADVRAQIHPALLVSSDPNLLGVWLQALPRQ